MPDVAKTKPLNPALEIRDVVHRYGEVAALNGFSLTVRPGEILCLAGRSGCGKSTLLRVIAGIERPADGEVLLGGHPVTGQQTFVEPEQRGIGFMFQDYALFPHLNVIDNIGFGLRRLDRREARRRCEDIVGRLGIEHLTARFPHMLSGGEQQRVALARALAPQPSVLLMDEPFSNLDREMREAVRQQTISLLRELGTTAVMVTHDPEEALSAGDRVALMRAGMLEQAGSGAELYDSPNSLYAAEFFGMFNRLPGIRRAGAVETALGRFAAPGTEGAQLAVMIRPHDLQIGASGMGPEATVIASTFMGEIEQIHVRIDGIEEPLLARSTKRRSLKPYDKVSISVAPERVLVF